MAQEIFQWNGDYYVGRTLKSGNISKDSYKLSREEILYLFSEILQDYCLRNQKPLEIMRNGKPFIRATLVLK